MKQKPKMGLGMFDLLKGVIIFYMIFRHTVAYVDQTDTLVEKLLFTMFLPTLFTVSGYWLKKRKLWDGLKNSVQSLLKPYLVVCAVILVVGAVHRALIHNMRDWMDSFLIPILLGTSDGGRSGAAWFILALFIGWCLFFLAVDRLGEKGQLAAACVGALVGALLLPLRPPFQLGQGLIAFFYVYAGYHIKRKKLLERELSPWIYALLIAVWAAGSCFGSLNLSTYKIENGILSIPGALCGSFLLIRLFLRLNALEWRVLDPIRWLGRYSLWVLYIHSVEDMVFPWKILFLFVPRESFLGLGLHFVLRMALNVTVCHGMLWLRRRSAAKKRVGAAL